MAIRFYCRRCNQLLAIATRKAGSEIRCPKCGEAQGVPTPGVPHGPPGAAEPPVPAAADIESMGVSAWLPPGSEPAAPPMIAAPMRLPGAAFAPAAVLSTFSSDSPEPADQATDTRVASPPVVFAPVELPSVVEQPIVTPPEPALPPGMVLLRRRTMHVQAAFFLLLAAGMFGLGYYVGTRSSASQLALGPAQASAAVPPTMVEGQVIYESAEGRLLGDVGATVIALPEGKLPKTPLTLSTQNTTAPLLRELGGVQVRALAKGQFSLLLRPGNYRILFISAHARRAAGQEIDEADLGEIRRYLAAPQTLIGPFKYAWGVHPIGPGQPPPNHDFGRGAVQ